MRQPSEKSLALSAAVSLVAHCALLIGLLQFDFAGNAQGLVETLRIRLLPAENREASQPSAITPEADEARSTPAEVPAEASDRADLEPAAEAQARALEAGIEVEAGAALTRLEPVEPAAVPDPVAPDPETVADTDLASTPDLARDPDSVSGPVAQARAPGPQSGPAAAAAEPAAIATVLHEQATAPSGRRRIAMQQSQADMLNIQAAEWAEAMSAQSLPEPGLSWQHEGRPYRAEFVRQRSPGAMGLEQVIVTVHSEYNGSPVSTEMFMTRLAFSHFAQFIDRWDPSVQIHDDEIDGRFHSNSEIFVDRSNGIQPTFHGKVTTARGVNTSRSARRIRRSEIFLGGLETRTARIALPRELLNGNDRGSDSSWHLHEVERDSRIAFHADGSYTLIDLDEPTLEQHRQLADGPNYLIAADKTVLHVGGVLNGQVLVYSPEGIVIEGNLTYAADPDLASADDYLGLASDRSVTIAGPDVTGPGDLHVHAAIYARSRFAVRGFRSRGQGTLFIHGSVTAGSLSATEPRYRTKLGFDKRFEHTRPPGFPMTDRYELSEWDGAWHAVSE